MSGESTPSITTSKSTNWIITLNNPTQEDKDSWTNIKQNHFVKEANGQLEVGADGTPHIQGFIRTESIRFSQLKKILPRAHIEIAKNALAAKQYCSKPETRLQELPCTDLNTSIHSSVYFTLRKWLKTKHLNDRWEYEDGGNWCEYQIDELVSNRYSMSLVSPEQIEYLYDKAVSDIIASGVKHIEFIAVNQITRSAFIKYFPALIYREHNAQKVRQEVNAPPPQNES